MFHASVKNVTRQFPSWNLRARIRKVDEAGDIVKEQYAFGGQTVRVSPRYQRNGSNFRVRPEDPVAFFAAFCFEQGLLPTQLTAEECKSGWALELLEPLWEENKYQFPKLESPFAACDDATEPSLRVGYSFNISQALVEQLGAARTTHERPMFRPAVNGQANPQNLDALRRKIEEQRARATSANGAAAPAAKKKPAGQ